MIHDTILSCIGETPLVRMDKIAAEEGFKCNLYAKCEFFNAGGSVKDRIALRMVEQAEKDGVLVPGKSVIVEASSGNTGIGLALVAAVKGYRCIITMPEKMSFEKSNTMKALGAEIVRTPTEAAHDSPHSNMGVAKRLTEEIACAVMLDQYRNPNNPDAHYFGTAAEIVESLSLSSSDVKSTSSTSSLSRPSSNQCDVLIAGAGTGGTLTGMSRRLREANENVVIVGIDPRGSILARPEALNTLEKGESDLYKVEGIGYDFIPEVLLHSSVDAWVKTNDADSFLAARRLIRTEGLLCGGSCGAALSGALVYLHSEEGQKWSQLEGANVVILLADSIRNYITSPWLTEAETESPKINGNGVHVDSVESLSVNLRESRIE